MSAGLPSGGCQGAVPPLRWEVEVLRSDPGTVHGRPLPTDGRRHLTVVKPTTPAVVLGSTQADDLVLPGHARVRRRGGGGAVWVEPGVGWFELFVPAGDPLWTADVGRSFLFAGHLCADVLEPLIGRSLRVHQGRFEPSRWSRLVCFAGAGPGEVFVEGRKLVGLTQRRARAGSRFAGIVYDRWEPERLLDRLRLDVTTRHRAMMDLVPAGIGLGDLSTVAASQAVEHLAANLASSA